MICEGAHCYASRFPNNFSSADSISKCNLIYNFKKYIFKYYSFMGISQIYTCSPNFEKIIVKIETVDNQVQFSVKDFGIGKPEDKKDKVFEPYYRVSGDQQTVFLGFGLGLYISSQISERSKGKISGKRFYKLG